MMRENLAILAYRCARWSGGSCSTCSAREELVIMLCATWSKPTLWSTTVMKATETMAISSQGAHQREFCRKSLKVLLGATNVFRMRCASDKAGGAVCGAAAGMELISNAPSAQEDRILTITFRATQPKALSTHSQTA